MLLPLVDLLLKSVVVLSLAGSVSLLWRGVSAANRQVMWLAAFVMLALLPLTLLVTPKWHVGPVVKNGPVNRDKSVATVPPRNIGSGTPAGRHESGVAFDWQAIALCAWGVGVFLLLAWRMAGGMQLRRLMRQSRAVNAERTLQMARQIAEEKGIRMKLRESEVARVPMTWGALPPVVFLPLDSAEWNDAQLAAVLLHEAGHVQRRDYLTRLLAEIVCAIYWVNPLVWLAAREMRLAQELACDDDVLRSGLNAGEYANQLVEVVRSLQSTRPPVPQALAMAHSSTLETRVRAIMEQKRNRQPSACGATVISIITGTAVLFLSALAQIGAADSPAPAVGNTDRGSTIIALVEKIHTPLPAGWKVSYQPKNTALIVERNEPVTLNESDMPNGPFTMKGRKPPTIPLHFSIVFDIEPYTLNDAEYTRLKAENVEINKKLTVLYDKMRRIDHKYDDFVPKTENEKKQVDAYNQLKATLHVIPEYRYKDISLVYYDPFMMGKYEFNAIVDDVQRKECGQVFKQVLSLFAKYPGVD